MIVRSIFTLFFISILSVNVLIAINPEYYGQNSNEDLASLIQLAYKQLNDQHVDLASSENNENNNSDDNDDDQIFKRNKYPNFHVSPLWLSRRTRTNRMYGKPLWISRIG